MLGINSQNEKLPILVVGKSKNPRCFKKINFKKNLNVYYYSNTSSWITKDIFRNYLHNLNVRLLQENWKIVIIDNFTGYVLEEPSNILFCFLPSNSTSKLQHLDQGIIYTFKCYYKKYLNRFINFKLIELNNTLKEAFGLLDLLQTIHWGEQLFNEVTLETTKNCWINLTLLFSS